MNLILAQSRAFNSVVCDLWKNENGDVFMTREQIGQALEYSEPMIAIGKIHKRHEKRLKQFSVLTKLVNSDGKQYETYIYNEKGIYEIIRKSQQPKADEFYDFVYDLLEKLRKGGLKVVQTEPKLPSNYKEALIALLEKEEEREQLELANKQKDQIIGEMKPKADYTDRILNSKGLMTITQIAKDYGMSGQAMNNKLHDLGVQYNQGGQWLLYSKYHDKGFTHSQTIDITRSNGSPDTKLNTKWTQKGRLFLYNLLKSKGIVPVIERNDKPQLRIVQ